MADKWNRYAEARKHLNYYKAVRGEILRYSPGESILDVGCGGTDIVLTGDFSIRHAVNATPIDPFPAELFVGSWPEIELPRERYDVVTCCQVLEHLRNEAIPPFVRRLKETAGVLIVSVPYRWRAGRCKSHKQDPVTEKKLEKWMGKPSRLRVIEDGTLSRMIATYE